MYGEGRAVRVVRSGAGARRATENACCRGVLGVEDKTLCLGDAQVEPVLVEDDSTPWVFGHALARALRNNPLDSRKRDYREY
jgi:hypothetical protein